MANVFDAEQRDVARRAKGNPTMDSTNARIPSEAPLKVFSPSSPGGLPEQKSFRDNSRPSHGSSRSDKGSGSPMKSVGKK